MSETTPVRRPDMPAPGRADAETEGEGERENGVVCEGLGRCAFGMVGPAEGDLGIVGAGPVGFVCVEMPGGGTRTAGWAEGVGGEEPEGDGASTIHMLERASSDRFEYRCKRQTYR